MIRDPIGILESCLGSIRARNAELNALVWTDEKGARACAEASAARHARAAPLSAIDGLPIAVKANVAVKGAPWTAALTPFKDRTAGEDATAVAELRRAGAVIVGVANMHEAALGATTTSPLYGQAKHPHDSRLTPGGSSGGSAAAVASGMALAAIGTDTMGSVRLPSAYCGIAGFKPSFGRVSRRGVELLSWSLDHVGFHAASSSVLRDLLAATRFDSGDPYAEAYAPAPEGSVALHGLRVAAVQTPDVVLQDGVAACFEAAISAISNAGARVGDVSLAMDMARARRRGLLISEAEFASLRGDQLDAFLGDTSPAFRHMIAWGARQSAARLAAAMGVFGEVRLEARKIFADADIAVMPTTPHTAFPYTEPAPETQADLTVFANLAGLPATTIPMGLAANGLPAGLQIFGPRGSDHLVLSAAESIEGALRKISAGGAP